MAVEAVRLALQVQGLAPGELARLRLLADVTSRQIAGQAVLQRLPKPLLPAYDPLLKYRDVLRPRRKP